MASLVSMPPASSSVICIILKPVAQVVASHLLTCLDVSLKDQNSELDGYRDASGRNAVMAVQGESPRSSSNLYWLVMVVLGKRPP